MKLPTNTPQKKGFTLYEILLVLVIILTLITIPLAALKNAKEDTENAKENGNKKTLNDAYTRAILDGKSDPALQGNNAYDAANYLYNQGYFRLPNGNSANN